MATKELEGNNVEGLLVIKNPWPSIARTIYQDHKRYVETYMQPYPGYFYTGDGAARDEHGYIWIKGRVDGALVTLASGCQVTLFILRCYQRFRPPSIDRRDRVCSYFTQGSSRNSRRWNCGWINRSSSLCFCNPETVRPVCFLNPSKNMTLIQWTREFKYDPADEGSLVKEFVLQVRKVIGPFAAPKKVFIVVDLPKTRSGKVWFLRTNYLAFLFNNLFSTARLCDVYYGKLSQARAINWGI